MATIMIVDDTATNRKLLSTLLGYKGHRILQASNGAEGLGMAKVERPDLVIADILMPKMDGYEFVRELRSDPVTAATRVIFHTAEYLEGEVRMMAEASGVEHILPKPSDPEVIFAVVDAALKAELHTVQPLPGEQFRREHLTLLNEKLLQKVRELEQANLDRQRLLAHLVNAQEEERKKIAGDIHDDSIQVMTAVRIRLEMLTRKVSDPEQKKGLVKLEDTVTLAIARLRHLLFQLRPPALDREGFPAALAAHLQQVCGEAELEYFIEDRVTTEPPTEVKVLLYRIAQEALANVVKHAGAKSVRVNLDEAEGGIRVQIADDGRGFSNDKHLESLPGHMGVPAMRERAEIAGGRFEIRSSPETGTTVEYWIPLPASEPSGVPAEEPSRGW